MRSQNSAGASHYLGMDFGKAKIGLAVADSETRIAFAYKTINNDIRLWDILSEIIKKEGVEKIILGRPRKMAPLALAFDAEKLAEELKSRLGIQTELQDEMFSTKQAEKNLKAKGAKKIKALDNQEAARIILQSWLDRY